MNQPLSTLNPAQVLDLSAQEQRRKVLRNT